MGVDFCTEKSNKKKEQLSSTVHLVHLGAILNCQPY